MKALLCALLIIAIAVGVVHAGPEHLIKQRSKDVRDQSNERQGVVSPSPSGAPAGSPPSPQPATAPPAARPSGPALSPQASQLAQSLGSLSAGADVTESQKQQLHESLVQAARGEVRPSEAKIRRLAGDLAAAAEGTSLNSSQRSTLASQLERALNESLEASEMEALASQVLETLRGAGAGKVDATIVANDLKSIIAELRRGAKH